MSNNYEFGTSKTSIERCGSKFHRPKKKSGEIHGPLSQWADTSIHTHQKLQTIPVINDYVWNHQFNPPKNVKSEKNTILSGIWIKYRVDLMR